MKIKSAQSFRKWYKTVEKRISITDKNYDENFIGTYYDTESNERIKGFFEMYHGHKPDIANYLPSILKIAEDGQAIYEFLQNAVDCKSSHFYIFYNKEYFLAINNGAPFEREGLQSILNIAQTTKKDPDKIGRFGIGFKLAHRLVGKNEGTDELVNEYKGPILFSWSKQQDFIDLLKNSALEAIDAENFTEEAYNDLPYLMKLILTNFPAGPDEVVKDIKYQDNKIFPKEELEELTSFLKENLDKHAATFRFEDLTQGTLFFIKLGQNKSDLLERDYAELKNGIEYSMNTLKNLKKVYINDDDITKIPLEIENGIISTGSTEFNRIQPEYKEFDIKFSVGFNSIDFEAENPYVKIYELREKPNFYKYFPMGDEINGLGIIIHCDSFSNEANRRKLHIESTNKELFPVIANFIKENLEIYKLSSTQKYLNLYACLLLSDIPKNQNNSWLKPIFNDIYIEYLKSNVPTLDGCFRSYENVRIKDFDLDVPLDDLGLGDIKWFKWQGIKHLPLIKEAKDEEKISLKKWDLHKLIIKAETDLINNWIEKLSQSQYNDLITELSKNTFKPDFKHKIKAVKLFKFNDGKFYSLNDLTNSENLLFQTEKIAAIIFELKVLGFNISSNPIKDLPNNLQELIVEFSSDEEEIYHKIANKTAIKNNLSATQKLGLFKNLSNQTTKFKGIAAYTLEKLCLFKNNIGDIIELNQLIPTSFNTPNWLNPYKIDSTEYNSILDSYLMKEDELYTNRIIKNWEDIIQNINSTNIQEFYEKVIYYFNCKPNNPVLNLKKCAFVNDEVGFCDTKEIIYNEHFSVINNYTVLQSAILKITDYQTPHKTSINFLKTAPFSFDNESVSEYISEEILLDEDEIKTLLAYLYKNNEQFFEKFIIEDIGSSFRIIKSEQSHYQYDSNNKLLKKFIQSENSDLSNYFKLLPNIAKEYKDKTGVLKGDRLEHAVLKLVDIDEHQEILNKILCNDSSKKIFITNLYEIHLDSTKIYSKDDFAYQILYTAIKLLRPEEYSEFREKINIITETEELPLSKIPANKDDVEFEGIDYKLSLTALLPNQYENNNFLSRLITNFSSLGIEKTNLKYLLGIKDEIDYEQILSLMNVEIDNPEQLAFILLYHNKIGNLDLSNYNIKTINGSSYSINDNYYVTAYNFIPNEYTLSTQYEDISKILKLPYDFGEVKLLKEPYVKNNEFICPEIDTCFSEETMVKFLDFIYEKWKKEKSITSINWDNLLEKKKDDSIFSFFIKLIEKKYVHPEAYATDEENVPVYIIEWLEESEERLDFLTKLGLWTEESVLINLRKSLSPVKSLFDTDRLIKELDLYSFYKLEDTLYWICDQEYKLCFTSQYDVFNKVIELINKNSSFTKFIIKESFDYELLENESVEWDSEYYSRWQEKTGFKIYIYSGNLPKTISIERESETYPKYNDFQDYIFFEFYANDIAINANSIYINKSADLLKALSTLVGNEDNDFTSVELLELYKAKDSTFDSTIEIQSLKDELATLKNQLAVASSANLGSMFDDGLSKEEQIEANKIVKRAVIEKLEKEGFEFREGIGTYSTINGVFKDNEEYPLVVKSYKASNNPLKLGANEWIHLLKPNSMFWLQFADGRLGCIKLNDLLSKQDKLTLSFSTANLQRTNKIDDFAKILRYFENVHFNFDSINPNNYKTAQALSDYRFNVQGEENDLTADSPELL